MQKYLFRVSLKENVSTNVFINNVTHWGLPPQFKQSNIISHTLSATYQAGVNVKRCGKRNTHTKNNEFSTGTHGTQLWMNCSSSWYQSATVSVIRHKQKLSNSAEGHQGRFHSYRISIIAILYYINSLGRGGNLQWKRLECLLGCSLSNWLWRPQADGMNRAAWMQVQSPSVCMHVCQSVWYLSISLFTMCVFVCLWADLQTPQVDPVYSQWWPEKKT